MKPICSLSLDLDNLWTYMKIHGDEGWQEYPSYFSVFVPRYLEFMDRRNLKTSVFIVGKDASIEKNKPYLKMIADAGHEICNHSFHHEPWLHLYSPEQIRDELSQAEASIEDATGIRPSGFRGPGFSFSSDVLEYLASSGYEYDASTFPTFIGPLARLYYFRTAKLPKEEREQRNKLFGSMKEVFRPNKPYFWETDATRLLEIPVTTIPILRAPFHFSYLNYLAQYSSRLAGTYLGLAVFFCRLTRTEPSMLLHPLDFLGADDTEELGFFPGMTVDAATKLKWMSDHFDRLEGKFNLVTMGQHRTALTSPNASRALPTVCLSQPEP